MKYALLVIDAQQEYFAPHGGLPLPGATAALANILRLLSVARDRNDTVIHISHESLDPDAALFRHGSDGASMHEAIAVQSGELQILKHVPGSFTGTALEQILRRVNSDALIICGYMTQQCCEMTTRQASERGITTIVAADACAARALSLGDRIFSASEVHEATLAVLTQYARVLTTHEILRELGAEPVKAGTAIERGA